MSSPSTEQAEERAREMERLITLVEHEARKSDYMRTRWVSKRELESFAGALRFSLRYLLRAIKGAREGVIVCSSCKRETLELARSKNLDGARCVACAVPALDEQIAKLTAELARVKRNWMDAESVGVGPIFVQPARLPAKGTKCRTGRKPSARRKPPQNAASVRDE